MTTTDYRGVFKPYKSYNFKDKDPIIDRLRTAIRDEGVSWGDIHETSGVSVTTLNNWFNGDTLRPRFATVMAVFRSIGYDLQIVKAAHGRETAQIITIPHRRRA